MGSLDSKKEAAVDFLRMCATARAKEAFERYAAPDFRHHNPHFTDDAGSLAAGMEANARQFPDKKIDVLRVIGEGDLVAVHSVVHHEIGDRGFGLVHIFRFAGDKVVELWDLAQEVPAESPNASGMF